MADPPPIPPSTPRSVDVHIGGDVSGGVTVVEGARLRPLTAPEFGASDEAHGYLRMLALLASPVAGMDGEAPDSPTLDVWREWEHLRRALGTRDAVTGTGPPWAVIRLAPPTLEALGDTLAGGDPGYQVLHLGCHGTPDGVVLEDPLGREALVPTERLVKTLRGSTVRLVVLNACETEQVARALVDRAGVPAVLATERPILDTEAAILAERLYRRLGAGDTLAHALEAVRDGIRTRIERGDLAPASDDETPEDRCTNLRLIGDGALTLELTTDRAGHRTAQPAPAPLFVLNPTPHNEPLPLDRTRGFVGRHAQRLRLARWLRDTGSHVFALHGVGGIGKTALALETALRKAHRFQAFAFATAKADPDFGPLDALRTVAAATDRPVAPQESEEPIPALTRRLNHEPILLVLDNLEAVGREAADELTRALRGVDPRSGSRVILTLRPRQKSPLTELAEGKDRLRLERLDAPSALRLAWEQAGRQGLERFERPPDPELTRTQKKSLDDLARRAWVQGVGLRWLAALRGLCARTFGHPTMIRLAVAMVPERGWDRTRARLEKLRGKKLEQALQELIGTMVDDLEDQDPQAIEVLHACAVFQESAPLGDLRLVVLGKAVDDDSAAALEFEDGPLQTALDSNLLTRATGWYDLDPTVRAYLETHRPPDPGTQHQYRMRHATALLPHLEALAEHPVGAKVSLAAIPRWAELTSTWDWLAARSAEDEGAAGILRAHSRSWGNLLRNTYEPERLTWLRAASSAHHAADDTDGQANTLQAIGHVLAFQKDNDQALQHYKRAQELFEDVGDRLGQANTLGAMGRLALVEGDREQGEELIAEAADLFEKIGDRYSLGALWCNCGVALARAGRFAEAKPWLQQAAAHFHEIGMPEQAATAERALEAIDSEP